MLGHLRPVTKPLRFAGAGDPADDRAGDRDDRQRDRNDDHATHLTVVTREALAAQAQRERQDQCPDEQGGAADPEGVHRAGSYRTDELRSATARTRAGGCGSGSPCGPRRGGRGLRGPGCPVPPLPSLSTVASSGGTGSAWIARHTIQPRAMIGIFSPNISHMNAHVTVARMVPRVGPLEQDLGIDYFRGSWARSPYMNSSAWTASTRTPHGPSNSASIPRWARRSPRSRRRARRSSSGAAPTRCSIRRGRPERLRTTRALRSSTRRRSTSSRGRSRTRAGPTPRSSGPTARTSYAT